MANVRIYKRFFFTFLIFAKIRPVRTKVIDKQTQTDRHRQTNRHRQTDRQTDTDRHAKTDKPTAIVEILKIFLKHVC